ncbi:MAG: hypothetical protein ABSB42_22175 [Tepidisphaeraceae bacterium]|jgi:hypothetical protein
MRLTLVIASVIFTAVLTYAKLMALAHGSPSPGYGPYDGPSCSPLVHANLAATPAN